jgi:DNA modification methylase
MQMAIDQITHRCPVSLCPRTTNPRTHSKKQIFQIAASIEQFGFVNPVLVDREDRIVAGHGRVEAAKQLGLKSVPTICLENLTDEEIRAYVIADNRLAELAGWDEELLAIELQDLAELNLDFDVTITGFETPEIDMLISGLGSDEDNDPDDELPPVDSGPSVTLPGDIWCMGDHRLICGDATQSDTFAQLLNGASAEMVFTDPPYNVPINGHVSGLGNTKHREFAMASGEMSEAEFVDFLTNVFGNLAQYSTDGSMHFVCMDWRHIAEITAAGNASYTELKNVCVWAKTNGGMGSLYRSQHEFVFVFKAGKAVHINNIELGKHGRNRTNVWNYPGANSLGKDHDDELSLHPTVKPIALVADAIRDCSRRKSIILDAFCGSGTTLLAAERTGRRGYGIELDPRYCDVIIRRMQTATGVEATHLQTGRVFSSVAKGRAEQVPETVAENTTSEREVDHVV